MRHSFFAESKKSPRTGKAPFSYRNLDHMFDGREQEQQQQQVAI